MAFTSLNDYLNKTTNLGQIGTTSWQKMTGGSGVYVAGRWYNMCYLIGNPMLSRPCERMLNGQLIGNANNWTLGALWSYATPTNSQIGCNTLIRTAGTTSNAVAIGTKNIASGYTYGVEVWIYSNASGASTFQIQLGGVTQTALSISSSTAYQWHFKIPSTGTTGLTVIPTATNAGTYGNFSVVLFNYGVPLFSTDMGAMFMGNTVYPAIKQLLTSGVVSSSGTMVPGTWKLVDMLAGYPVDMTIATSQTLQMLGGQYLTNGGFTGGTSSWVVGADWSYDNNSVDYAGTGATTLSQPVSNFTSFTGSQNVPVVSPVPYVYNITYTITNVSGSSTLTVAFAGGTSTTSSVSNGTFTQFITAVDTTDGLIFSPSGSGTFTISNVSVTAALPRYSNGAGVRAMLCWQSGSYFAATTIPITVAHNISISYTNSSNISGQTLPYSVSGTIGAIPTMGAIDNSGIAANNTSGPFFPLAAGDSGVQSVQSFQLSQAACTYTVGAGTNAYANLILCREIMTIPNTVVLLGTERDLMNQVRSLPVIQDGANLQWLFMPAAASAVSSMAYGWLDYVWG